MAVPIIESSNTATSLAASSVVITKPTSLAVNDLLLAVIGSYDAGALGRTHTTPSGWTVIQKSTTTAGRGAAYYKVADAADVAAANFTFAMSGVLTAMTGYLARVSTYVASNPVSISEIDNNATTSGTSASFTTALTPLSPNSLAVFMYARCSTSYDTVFPSWSAYSSTPSVTWTEVADLYSVDGISDGLGMGIATATINSLSQITARAATLNQATTQDEFSIALLVNGAFDTTGTNALHSVSPTLFSQNGTCGTIGTNALHSVSPTLFSQSGTSVSQTAWINPDKPTTTWTNPNK